MGQQPKAQRSKVPRAVGLPWLQTQAQSCEQGLFLVQSCSFAKNKSKRAAPGLGEWMWEAEARRNGSRTLGEGQSLVGVINRWLQWGLPNGDPTTAHLWGQKMLWGLDGSRGNHPCDLCVCFLLADPAIQLCITE